MQPAADNIVRNEATKNALSPIRLFVLLFIAQLSQSDRAAGWVRQADRRAETFLSTRPPCIQCSAVKYFNVVFVIGKEAFGLSFSFR